MKLIDPATLSPAPMPEGPGMRKLTMVAADAAPHLIQFAKITLAPGQTVAAHAHKDWTEVYYVEEGEAVMTMVFFSIKS